MYESSVKGDVPRGYRKAYIYTRLDWNMLNIFTLSFLKVEKVISWLLHSIDNARGQKWTDTVESLD